MAVNEMKRARERRELSKPAYTSSGSTSTRPLNAKGNLAREL